MTTFTWNYLRLHFLPPAGKELGTEIRFSERKFEVLIFDTSVYTHGLKIHTHLYIQSPDLKIIIKKIAG